MAPGRGQNIKLKTSLKKHKNNLAYAHSQIEVDVCWNASQNTQRILTK